MLRRRVLSLVFVVLATGSLAVLPGCDWLKGSNTDIRQSPNISSLRVNPASVLCGATFNISFNYNDQQSDIAKARVTFQRTGDTNIREENPVWPTNISRGSGIVTFPFSFACDSKGGDWQITVEVQDDRSNTSNTLTGQIVLASAG